MQAKKTQHSVWIQDDLWEVLQAYLSQHDMTFAGFIEQCIIEKTGLNENLEKEVFELKQRIQREQELLEAKEAYLRAQKAEENKLDQHRYKLLKHLLQKPINEWRVPKGTIIKDGKFKNWDEVVEWVQKHQQNNKKG